MEDTNLGLNIKVKKNGKIEKLTKENYADYLGMEVTNFKDLGAGTETVSVIDGDSINTSTDYKVSTKYRLYYIDFDNKYGDGAGTIYLKANYAAAIYNLKLDSTDADAKTEDGRNKVKIKQLNPGLYKDKDGNAVQPPSKDNYNMKAVTWLLNEDNWKGLKTNLKEGVEGQINYIVGAPSLEMMIDSYNAHYGLKGDEPVPGDIETGGERKKLFYRYENGEEGYQIGPSSTSKYSIGFSALGTVQKDENIDTMYYPGDSWSCWIASPSACVSPHDCLWNTGGAGNARINACVYTGKCSLGPLVSINSYFELELK